MSSKLVITGIKKYFPGTQALDWDDTDTLDMNSGNVYALLGENGAGKSTLAKILAGIYSFTAGQITLNAQNFIPENSKQAREAGIGIILQEPGLIPSLRVSENLLIGKEKQFYNWKFYSLRKLFKIGQEILDHVCPYIDARKYVRDLSLEDQKMVELARATYIWPQVLLVDETSAALSKNNADRLFNTMRLASEKGSIVIFITHRMEEVFLMCNKAIVLKDGKYVGMRATSETNVEELSRMMVGRSVSYSGLHNKSRIQNNKNESPILCVRDLSYNTFKRLSFDVFPGHIVGFGGLTGGGKEDILPTIFGDNKHTDGSILLFNKQEKNLSPAKSIAAGIAYIPREREKEGLILRHSVMANIVLPSLKILTLFRFFVNPLVYRKIALKYSSLLSIKCKSINDLVDSLSGGNRQKVVVAKWISRGSKLMLLDNPTRGIDVGSRAEIYSLIEALADQGVGFVMVTDDMPELITMSDEIYVIKEGQVAKHYLIGETPEEHELVSYMI